MIRVLVIEDSPVVTRVLVEVIERAPDMTVIGTAHDGRQGIALARKLRPDVITMDLRMPDIDGLEATVEVMAENPVPIVIVSAALSDDELNIGFQALKAGAVDLFEKPSIDGGTMATREASRLVATVRAMAQVPVVRRPRVGAPPAALARRPTSKPPVAPKSPTPLAPWGTAPKPVAPPARDPAQFALAPRSAPRVIAIGASSGGPPALRTVIEGLPANLAVPVLIAQHIAPPFVSGLVTWLATTTRRRVEFAKQGAEPLPGRFYLPPGDRHLTVNPSGRLELVDDPWRLCVPNVDLLFESVQNAFGGAAIAVMLTGMGNDGARGMLALRRAGALTIAQHPDGCSIYGMPRAAVELDAAMESVLLERIADRCAVALERRRGDEFK